MIVTTDSAPLATAMTSPVQITSVRPGFTTRPMAQGDNCPGYWWSEQMKYYWLMFAQPKRVDLDRLVLSTEANVLRGFVR